MKKIILMIMLCVWSFASSTEPKVLFLHGGMHFSKVKANNVKKYAKEQNIIMEYKQLKAVLKDKNASKFTPYDLIMVQGVMRPDAKKLFNKVMQGVKQTDKKVVALRVRDIKKEEHRRGITLEQHKTINAYLGNGGKRNFENFAIFLANDIFGITDKKADKPFIYPSTGIYHPKTPEKIYTSLEEYLKFMGVSKDEKKLVGIMMYQGDFGSLNSALVDTTIEKLSKMQGVVPVAFYAPRNSKKGKDVIPYKEIISIDGKVEVDAIVYFQMMHNGLQKKSEFERLGIPVFGGMTYRSGTQEDYKWEIQGVDNFMLPFMLNNPEIAGVVNPMMVAAKSAEDETTQPIMYQLDAFLDRVQKYLVLQTKANNEKKVAWFFWNFAGQNGMGASNLNVPRSFVNIFKDLKAKGYDTKDINASYFEDGRVRDMMAIWYRDVDANELIKRDLCELYPLEKYESWFSSLPDYAQERITESWGQPNESNMLLEKDGKKYFVIPRMKIGKFIVLPQGSKSQGSKEDDSKSEHDKEIPLNHGYLSVYLYVKDVFKADAIVHMGTHGTQEWSEGKEKGLSIYDSPNLAVGNLPVFYPYIVDDIGEAIIAKRRGSAVIISHLTPPFAPAGLHDTLVEMHDLMHQYNEMTEGRTKEKTKQRLIEISKKENFDKDIDVNASEDFEAYVQQLHDYLEELASEHQPLGLHSFGVDQDEEHQVLTVMQMLGKKYVELANKTKIDLGKHKNDHDHGDGKNHSHAHTGQSHGHSHGDHSHDHGDGHSHGDHSHSHGETPHLGMVEPFYSGKDKIGYVELKLHDDKGDLELWLTQDKDGKKVYDLPLDTKITVSFPDLKQKAVTLQIRNDKQNEDEDGKGNIRNNKTNYFIFPGDTGVDASFLQGKEFSSETRVLFEIKGKKYKSTSFRLIPHTHGEDDHHHGHGDHGHSHDHGHQLGYEDINKSNPFLYIQATFEGHMPDNDELKPYLEKALKYKEMIRAKNETIALSDALDGKYIPTSTGGDPIRSPEALPTGRNVFGFDPAKVPTQAAYEAGTELTTEMINNYYKKHGQWPDKFAFTMFATETMRHYGVLESQILASLGVRPTWSKSGRVTGLEIIPYSELKRPRVDVVVSATSLYRDSMPLIMEWIDKAVKMVVELKEESNFVRRNALALQEKLIKDGLSKEDANKLSTIRVFSNAGGTSMGTGLNRAVADSGNWETDKAMSDEYLSRMGFAYGSGMHGKKVVKELYKMNLSGTDVVAFSRSSNLYGLLTADEPFQFFGGIGQAIRHIDGKTPEMFVMNLRNKDKAKVQDINSFISKELRTRYFHPQWIKAMQDEGMSGAQTIQSIVENAWGWDVMVPTAIRDDQWQEFVDVYVNDKHDLNMKEFFEKNDPESLAKISERILEAIRKDYFKADEATIQKLVETYMEVANKHDIYADNEKFKEYVKGKAAGYGLSPVLPSKVQSEFATKVVDLSGAKPKVEGQKLEEVKQTEVEPDTTYYYYIGFILGFILLGGIYEAMRKENA